MAIRVALTGATGFLGSHVARLTSQRGLSLCVLVRRPVAGTPLEQLNPKVVEGSLANGVALRRLVDGADVIIHCAGAIRAKDRQGFFAVNGEGVAGLAEAALAAPGRPRLILVSSIAAREPQISDYAASKRAGETVLERYRDRISYTILRPPAIYGPGDRATLDIFRAIKHGLVPIPGLADARLSLIHVEDAANAALAAALLPRPLPGTFEIDDGKPGGYGWNEVVAAAATAMGRPVRTLRVPPRLVEAAAHINQAFSLLGGGTPMFSPGKAREMLHRDWVARNNGFSAATGWHPQIAIAEGFAETVAWYRSAAWL